MCSVGLPLISLILTASPSLNPSTPSCEIGFCSKNSLTNSCAYRIVRRYRVGRRSFSIMDCDKSKTKIKCRIIPRCNGVVSLRSLQKYFELSTMALNYGHANGFYPTPKKGNLPLSFTSLQKPFNCRTDCAICPLDQCLPGPGDLPLCASTLFSALCTRSGRIS